MLVHGANASRYYRRTHKAASGPKELVIVPVPIT
jgi:hypothetical protein